MERTPLLGAALEAGVPKNKLILFCSIAIAVIVMTIAGWAVGGLLHGLLTWVRPVVLARDTEQVGYVMGIVFCIFDIGFCRVFSEITRGRTARMRQTILIFFFASLLALPLLWGGYEGHVNPLSFSTVVGAFIFGFGMNLCGSCASGVLVDVGHGETNSLVALAFFIVGSVLGAWQFAFWTSFGVGPSVNLLDAGFVGPAIQWIFLAALYVGCTMYERHVSGDVEEAPLHPPSLERLGAKLVGAESVEEEPIAAWPGALAVALIATLVLVCKHSPWGISSALAVVGAKPLYEVGISVDKWGYFSHNPKHLHPLTGFAIEDGTLLTDIGFVLGVLAVSANSGKFGKQAFFDSAAPRYALGGLLLGYGARLAFGCNIGAWLSGVSSFSLASWLWFFSCLPGYYAGKTARKAMGSVDAASSEEQGAASADVDDTM